MTDAVAGLHCGAGRRRGGFASCGVRAATGDAGDRTHRLGAPRPNAGPAAAFRQDLADAGYFDGQNVTSEYRWRDGRYDRLTALAADPVRRQVVATGKVPTALAAKAATTTIPIVIAAGDYPVKRGLAASLRCSLRSAFVAGICALGLIIPTTSRSADIMSDRRTPPDLGMAGTGSVEVGTPAADDSLSYLFTPFKLASQPNLMQSVFVFAGRTDAGNLESTFVYGVGAPDRIFYDNYIVGGAYQRDFFQFNSGLLIGAEVGLADPG